MFKCIKKSILSCCCTKWAVMCPVCFVACFPDMLWFEKYWSIGKLNFRYYMDTNVDYGYIMWVSEYSSDDLNNREYWAVLVAGNEN